MTAVNWPSAVTYSTGFDEEFDAIAEAVRSGDGEYPLDRGLSVYGTGKGRVVYDLSHETGQPTVLRIARNKTGVEETRREATRRDSFPNPLRSRLAPILDYGSDFTWSVQPKCDQVPIPKRSDARDELEELVEDAGLDVREVHVGNLASWNGVPVLFDYGGL